MNRTLLDLTLEQYGSVANLAETLGVARSPLSSALHGHRACSWVYWRRVGMALGIERDELVGYLLADGQRHGGGGSLAGSIRCRAA